MSSTLHHMPDWHRVCLEWRGLGDAKLCRECGGSGTRVYSTTATWRGGVGGSALTNGVCDHCWGSGDADNPWPSHDNRPSLIARAKVVAQILTDNGQPVEPPGAGQDEVMMARWNVCLEIVRALDRMR